MSRMRIPVGAPLHPELAAQVEKSSVYVSPHLDRLRVSAELDAVEFDLADGVPTEDVRGKIERYLASMQKGFRPLGNRVLHQNRRQDRGPLTQGTYEELRRRGWVLSLGPGQVGLAGPALALARFVDQAAAKLGRERMGSVEHAYPSLIPTTVLARCGYFSSFPQAISLVCHLIEDFDAIEQFRHANAANQDLAVPDAAHLLPRATLTPAVCYHCYQALEGSRIPEAGRSVTTVGRVFRYESRLMTGLDRLWDFSQRDVIVIGPEAYVTQKRSQLIEALSEQLAEWDLEATIETASDPFFPTVRSAKTYWQLSRELKYEVRVEIEPAADGTPRTLATSSINLHGDFFGRTFDFRTPDGQPAFTSCAGWGLERWVLAMFTQHGFEERRWPETLRRDVFA